MRRLQQRLAALTPGAEHRLLAERSRLLTAECVPSALEDFTHEVRTLGLSREHRMRFWRTHAVLSHHLLCCGVSLSCPPPHLLNEELLIFNQPPARWPLRDTGCEVCR